MVSVRENLSLEEFSILPLTKWRMMAGQAFSPVSHKVSLKILQPTLLHLRVNTSCVHWSVLHQHQGVGGGLLRGDSSLHYLQ